jgi:hypothetical protein
MAIFTGVAKHFAYASIDGTQYPVISGSVNQRARRESGEFRIHIPMNYNNGAAYQQLSQGATACNVTVQSVAGSGQLIAGIIDEISIDFPNFHGGGIISVLGRDQSAKLHQRKTLETFINQTTVAIVQQLCGRVGLGVSVRGGSGIMAGKYIDQEWRKPTDGVSYAAVIHQCAEIDNANWYVDPAGGTLYYVMGNLTTTGSYSVTYSAGPPVKGDYLKLSVIRNIEADANIQCTVVSWHDKQKQVNKGFATVAAGANDSLLLEYKHHIPNLTQDHCQKYAESFANDAARHALTVRCTLVGDPSIRPDMALQLNGTGVFDGPFQVDDILHNFGMSGYTMDVTAKTPGSERSAS